MLVANNSFDLWQRDAFFSAAEEVQESTDILESAYRTWLRVKREGTLSDLEELRTELQTALGTAKWQLEEFERAVRLSYGNCRDQNKMARHQQFVVAIESQISRVEAALRESLHEDGKQPLRWVNLDDNERSDLAMFLSGTRGTTTKSKRDESVKPSVSSEMENLYKKKDLDYAACSSSCSMEANTQTKGLNSFGNDIVINMGPDCVTELSSRESLGTRVDVTSDLDKTSSSTKRTRVSPKFSALKVVIPNEDDQMRALMPTVEDTPKVKGFRASNFLHLRGMSCINKLYNYSSGLNSRVPSRQRLQISSSLRLIIVLLLSSFLLVPYLIHSS